MAYTNEALGKALEDLTAAYQHFLDKAKDAAMAALSGTVIAQIKQDAKEHIASELAAQKAALEKAIETAKIALRNSAIEADTALKQAAEAKKSELAALITAAENTLNEKAVKTQAYLEKKINEAKQYIDTQLTAASNGIDTRIHTSVQAHIAEEEAKLLEKVNQKFIQFFTNVYIIQFPWMPRPGSVFYFSGYRWAEVNYDGCFFRAKGKGANPFDGDEQGDAIRNIKGDIGNMIGYEPGYGAPFYRHSPVPGSTWCISVAYQGYFSRFGIDASLVVPTAEENRPRNRTFIIWKLEKI